MESPKRVPSTGHTPVNGSVRPLERNGVVRDGGLGHDGFLTKAIGPVVVASVHRPAKH